MKKILFPYDFSETSVNAFRYALHLADKIHAEILTVHVYEVVSVYTDYYDVIMANYQVTDLKEFEDYKDEVPKLRAIADEENLSHVPLKHLLQEGKAADTILKVAKNSGDVIFIVMGTSGASGLKETFVGSVTEKVLNRSTCPVLAIPAKAHYRPIKKALFLSKFKPTDIPLLEQTQKIARIFGADLSVIHVTKHHDPLEKDQIREFKTALTGSDIRFHVLASNAIEDTINDFIEIDETDLIVLPVHFKNFFENLFLNSLSRQLVFHSKIPVMGIPVAT